MTRTMYDSVTVSAIPANATLVAGYIDGRYRTIAALHKRFPRATVVTITVLGTPGAHVADCETGDLTPPHAAAWAHTEYHSGRMPTIYTNTSTRPSVEAECRKVGLILGRHYQLWEAHYDGIANLPAGAVAKQYIDHGPHGENVDISIVADYWPGVDPTPKPPKPVPPKPSEEDIVRLYRVDGTQPVWVTNYQTRRWVQTPAELDQISKDTGQHVIVLAHGSTFLNAIPVVGAKP